MKGLGLVVVVSLALMAAVPVLMGAAMFAPVIILLALACVWAERRNSQ